jgi:predicted TIM-barrel fold metal-dependent hydrolase
MVGVAVCPCHATNPEGYRFCGQCGTALAVTSCPSCGLANAVGQHFCGDCGSALDVPADRGVTTSTPAAAEEQFSNTTAWIIDGDGHVLEPDDMWDRFLPERFRVMAPRLGGGVPVSDEVRPALPKMLSTEGGWLPARRLPDLDVDLIERAVLFPTLGLLLESVTDPVPAAAMHRAVNNWMAEYCAFEPSRLVGAAALPSTNGEDALAEARRCVEELGFRVVFRHPSLYPGTLPLHHAEFEPLWSYLEAANVTVVSHSAVPPMYCSDRYPDGFMASHVIHFVNEAMMAVTSFVLYGILERHPNLSVGLVEAGATWARSMCHRLDEHVEKAEKLEEVHYSLPPRVHLSVKPSEYFRRQCFVTCEEVEPGLPEMLAEFPDNVLFSSDYPHPDGVFPGSTTALLRATEISGAQRRAILRDNAIRHYRLH